MSVSKTTWYKLSLVQTVTASDGTLSSLKLGSVTVSPEVGAQLAGSTVEFEFQSLEVKADSQAPTTASLAKILIGL